MNRIAHLAALGLVLAFTFHGCNGCGKDDQDEGDDTEDNTGDDTEDNTDGKKKDGKKKDGKKKDGKKKGGKEEDTFFQATLYTNEYEGSEGLIKMIAVIGNASKKRCKINIISVPMKLATIYSNNDPVISVIGHDKKTKKDQDDEYLQNLVVWRREHKCSLDDTRGSCKIGTPEDLKTALDNAPWYFRKGGSLPMLKFEKNKEDEKDNEENEQNKKNEIKIFGVNSIETMLARKCLDSPNLDDDKSYFDMELRETYHSIIDPLMKIALYQRGNRNSLIDQLHRGLKSKTIEKLKRLDGIIEKLELYKEKNVKFTPGALAVLQLFGSTCPDMDEYFDLFKDMDAVAVSGRYTRDLPLLQNARHMQQFQSPTEIPVGDGTDEEPEMEKRRELNYLVKYFRSIQRKILDDKAQSKDEEKKREEKSVRNALENFMDSPLSLWHETTWENVYTHHPYATVKDKEVLTEKLDRDFGGSFKACRVKAPVPAGAAAPASGGEREFFDMDPIGNLVSRDPIVLYHDPFGRPADISPDRYPTKTENDLGFNKLHRYTAFRTYCPEGGPKKFPEQCKKLEQIAEKQFKEDGEHRFRGYARAAELLSAGMYDGKGVGFGNPPGMIDDDIQDQHWVRFCWKMIFGGFVQKREFFFFNKWKMAMRLTNWMHIINDSGKPHWYKDIKDRHKILVLLYMSKRLIQEKGDLVKAAEDAYNRYWVVKQYEDSLTGIAGTNVDYMILRALYVNWKPTKEEKDLTSNDASTFLNNSFELIYGYPVEEPEKKPDHFLEQDDDKFFNSPMPLHLSMDG